METQITSIPEETSAVVAQSSEIPIADVSSTSSCRLTAAVAVDKCCRQGIENGSRSHDIRQESRSLREARWRLPLTLPGSNCLKTCLDATLRQSKYLPSLAFLMACQRKCVREQEFGPLILRSIQPFISVVLFRTPLR